MEELPLGVSTWTMDVAVAPPANLQPPRGLRRRRRDNQAALIAWLDEQERLLRMRGTPDAVVQEFDPLHNLPEPQGDDVEQGRRTILFRFTVNVEGSIADQIQAKIVEHVRARFMLKLSSLVELRNIEDNTLMEFYQRPEESGGISPWFETLTASENWVRRQEEARLHSMRRPDTKWVYERTVNRGELETAVEVPLQEGGVQENLLRRQDPQELRLLRETLSPALL